MITRFKSFILFFLVLLAVTAQIHCSKSGQDAPQPGPELPVKNPNFKISFPEESIAAATVDSALVTFTSDLKDTLRKKAFVADGQIALRMELAPATWTVSVKLYTKQLADGSSRMYRVEKPFMYPNASTTIQGPTNKLYGQWKPTILFNAAHGIRMAIAERPDDPYYELYLPANHPYGYMFIDRGAFKLATPEDETVAYAWKVLDPISNYHGHSVDTSFFKSFSKTVSTAAWDYWDIYLVAQQAGKEEEVLVYQKIDKRP